jgi:ferritin-like metal-binding protein YciE
MAVTEMRELLLHELGDILYAERKFLTGTKGMAREVNSPEMKARLEEHVRETEGQIERIQEVFKVLGEKVKAEKCEAAIGLREEHDSFKSEEKPSKPILEAFDIGSGLRIEHYEIAAYRTAIAIATAMGENECLPLLQESLLEEEAMAKFLEKNAVRAVRKLIAQTQAE